MVLCEIFLVSPRLTFVFFTFVLVSRTEKKRREKIAVCVWKCGFGNLLNFRVISCLVFMDLCEIFLVSPWLTFVFFTFVLVNRSGKRVKKKKKKKNRRRCVGVCFS